MYFTCSMAIFVLPVLATVSVILLTQFEVSWTTDRVQSDLIFQFPPKLVHPPNCSSLPAWNHLNVTYDIAIHNIKNQLDVIKESSIGSVSLHASEYDSLSTLASLSQSLAVHLYHAGERENCENQHHNLMHYINAMNSLLQNYNSIVRMCRTKKLDFSIIPVKTYREILNYTLTSMGQTRGPSPTKFSTMFRSADVECAYNQSVLAVYILSDMRTLDYGKIALAITVAILASASYGFCVIYVILGIVSRCRNKKRQATGGGNPVGIPVSRSPGIPALA